MISGTPNVINHINENNLDSAIYIRKYSQRKQELKQRIIDHLEENSLQKNLRPLYFREEFKDNWLEIRNLKILISLLKNIIKFIDNPTYKNLEIVRWLAFEFDNSDKIFLLYRTLGVLKGSLCNDDDLYIAISPAIKEMEKNDYDPEDYDNDTLYECDMNIIDIFYNEDVENDSDSD